MRFSCLSAFLLGLTLSASAVYVGDDDCVDGSCPLPSTKTASAPYSEPKCEMWLAPSPIKEREEHGFGLGVFTGRAIKKGESVEGEDGGEILIPIYDELFEHHPPLREYLWDSSNMPEIAPESTQSDVTYFIPGLAAIAACTSKNYNVKLTSRKLPDKYEYDNMGVHRSRDPSAGSFSYRHKVQYTAVRDIVAGEELTVGCSDDDFDGGAYFLDTFHADDVAVSCIDSHLKVKESRIQGAGKGLFSKQRISRGTVVTSTPLVPIHRSELVMDDDEDLEDSAQLLLNYCFSSPNSNLYLLPYGPLVNYINHSPEPNVQIRWHPEENKNGWLPPRQQHHHPELFDLPADLVAGIHGKGLMMDIVAIKDIQPNDEIVIDYGSDWENAWKGHVAEFSKKRKDTSYVSAFEFNSRHGHDSVVHTTSEYPYPESLQTACWFNSYKLVDPSFPIEELDCIAPCEILERHDDKYVAKLLPYDNDFCPVEKEKLLTDLPRSSIRILDAPATNDAFMEGAFRHAMGVPDGFFPDIWMIQKVRRRAVQVDDGSEFKRKRVQ